MRRNEESCFVSGSSAPYISLTLAELWQLLFGNLVDHDGLEHVVGIDKFESLIGFKDSPTNMIKRRR